MKTFQHFENLALETLKKLYQHGINSFNNSSSSFSSFSSSNLSTSGNGEANNLVNGLVLAWQGDRGAISLLENLGKSSSVCWAYIGLAKFFSEINDMASSKITITFADNLILLSKETNSLSDNYLSLIKAESALKENLTSESFSIVTSLLINTKDDFIKVLAKYLLSLIYKKQQDIINFNKTVDELLVCSNEKGLEFLKALCKMQRSVLLVDENLPLAIEYVEEAKNIFGFLGAKLQENLAKSRLSQLKKENLENFYNVDGYLFISAEMRKLRGEIAKVLCSEDPPASLILGPSGSGKSSIARVIHKLCNRKGEFIGINCSSISETLIESELFGYEKGAFTGATANKIGIVEKANNGTIFLDELAESSQEFQKKLLKVIEEKAFYPVGATKLKKVDILFIGATNKPLHSICSFIREDLLHRFRWQFSLAGLSERREEILLLANEFIKRYSKNEKYSLTPEAEKLLLTKTYKGNIRTLENNIRNALNRASAEKTLYIHDYMIVDTLFDSIRSEGSSIDSIKGNNKIAVEISDIGLELLIGQAKKEVIEFVLRSFDDDQKRTREYLKIQERTFRRYLQSLNIS